jgi:hypothetical protein
MNLTPIDESGAQALEGVPGEPFMAGAGDIDRLIEACFAERAHAALLYAANMPPAFFDLSSGEAGMVLQKLRNYRIRLALVCPQGSVQLSSRFGELLADERRGHQFGLFETRSDALAWLGQGRS